MAEVAELALSWVWPIPEVILAKDFDALPLLASPTEVTDKINFEMSQVKLHSRVNF